MATRLWVFLFGVCLWPAYGLEEPRLPRFTDYPAQELYTGKVAAPRLIRPEERRYRSAIRNGVLKGYGVLHGDSDRERLGPNFAGRFIIVQWGCGSECLQYAIVDAKTGMIHQPPLRGQRMEYFDAGRLEFRTDSRLIISYTNCEPGDGTRCDRDFFVWRGRRFDHLRFEPHR